MLAADVIVLTSPIYFYSMTAQLKAVIDRSYAFFSQLAGKTFYFSEVPAVYPCRQERSGRARYAAAQ